MVLWHPSAAAKRICSEPISKLFGSKAGIAARSVLAEAGDQSDLESIENSYEAVIGELERADIINALVRMETGRRNSFYGRVRADSDLVSRAIQVVRAGPKKPPPVGYWINRT